MQISKLSDRFIVDFDHHEKGRFNIKVRLACVDDLLIWDWGMESLGNMQYYYLLPCDMIEKSMHDMRVEIYQDGDLVHQEEFEKKKLVFFNTFYPQLSSSNMLTVRGEVYDILTVEQNDNDNDLYHLPDKSIAISNGLQYIPYVEIFCRGDYYNDAIVDFFDNGTVLDIGSNIGLFSLYSLGMGAKKVYAFEPMRHNYVMSLFNTKDFRDDVICINAGVGDIDGWVGILCDIAGSGSSHKIQPTGWERFHHEETDNYPIEVWHPNSIFRRLDLGRVDVLKLDCEGGEYNFLELIDDEYLCNVRWIICEWHIYCKSDYDRYLGLNSRLSSVGFSVESNKINNRRMSSSFIAHYRYG